MSGRFDGNHSTIGHTPKYTHDCRQGALENAQRFGKSGGGQLPVRLPRRCPISCSIVIYTASGAMPASLLLPDR
jgi:hypothetical protein